MNQNKNSGHASWGVESLLLRRNFRVTAIMSFTSDALYSLEKSSNYNF